MTPSKFTKRFLIHPFSQVCSSETFMSRHEVRIHFEGWSKLVDGLIDSSAAAQVESHSCIDDQRLRIEFLRSLYLSETLIISSRCYEKICIPMMCSSVIRIQLKTSCELFFTFAKVAFDVPLKHGHRRVSLCEGWIKRQRHRRRRLLLLIGYLQSEPMHTREPVRVTHP